MQHRQCYYNVYFTLRLTKEELGDLKALAEKLGIIISGIFTVAKSGEEEKYGVKVGKARLIHNLSTEINEEKDTVNKHISDEKKKAICM